MKSEKKKDDNGDMSEPLFVWEQFFYAGKNVGILVKGSVRMSVRPLSFRKNCQK